MVSLLATVEPSSDAIIKKQIEYYMSDGNLLTDNFFRRLIQADDEGWVWIGHFLNCNKVKKLGITKAD